MNKGPIENKIINTLNECMTVSSLKIINESYMHNVPKDAESHFKIVLVSNDFNNLSHIERHKLVYKHLDTIMNDIHALSIQPFNEDEFRLNPIILDSPECAHKKMT
jgi:BolA protein